MGTSKLLKSFREFATRCEADTNRQLKITPKLKSEIDASTTTEELDWSRVRNPELCFVIKTILSVYPKDRNQSGTA